MWSPRAAPDSKSVGGVGPTFAHVFASGIAELPVETCSPNFTLMDARELLPEATAKARLDNGNACHAMKIQHVSDVVRFRACKKYPSSSPPFETDLMSFVDDWTASVFSTNAAATQSAASAVGLGHVATDSASAVGLGHVAGDSASAVGHVRTGAWFSDLDTVLLRPLLMQLRTSGGVYATMPAESNPRFKQTDLTFLTRPVRTPGAREWQALPAYFCEGSQELDDLLYHVGHLLKIDAQWPYRTVMQALTTTIRVNGHTCDILPPEAFAPIRQRDSLNIFKAGWSVAGNPDVVMPRGHPDSVIKLRLKWVGRR